MVIKTENSLKILHYPKLDSIFMVEKTIQESEDYPTRMELWKNLPKQMQYQTFKLILEYLEKSNKIMFKDDKIIWIFANNKKLNRLIEKRNYKRGANFKLDNPMQIKEVRARAVLDSRKEKTIEIIIKTPKGAFKTSSPSGKSTGKYEAKPYKKNLTCDISMINKLNINNINNLINKKGERKISCDEAFSILKDIEKLVFNKIGANSLYAFEASILKAIAHENKKELFEFLGAGKKDKLKIRNAGNTIGGGVHSNGINNKKPVFQEFLFIANGKSFYENVKTNKIAYSLTGRLLNSKSKNDEGAWETDAGNEKVLMVMNKVRQILKQKNLDVDIGIDCASSTFYKNRFYDYKNPARKLNKKQQIDYINYLINNYKIFYIEDALDEDDFKGFAELLKEIKKSKTNCLILGDDLIATNPERLKKAIKNKSINAVIVKPNQIGSLIKVKEVIELAKKYKIKTIISHRSGETLDNTIADLAVAWGCDFIKTGIYGRVREAKLKRLIEIEKSI